MVKDKVILHCDANNFYASVEITKDQKLKGKAIAVVGDPAKRHGIVLAKSNLAKSYGVQTGDVIWEAEKKCPNLILLPADYEAYMEYSDYLFEIYTRYSDRVEPYGLDECWLDCTGMERLYKDGKSIADEIRQVVEYELGLTISVGVSFTKIFAKLGSDMKKPNATTVIPKETFKEKIWNLPVEDLIFIGKATKRKLNDININTIGELAHANHDQLNKKFGIIGNQLINTANGIELPDESVRYSYEKFVPKSVGHSSTTPRDMYTRDEIKSLVYTLSDQIAFRLRRYKLMAKGVHISLRDSNLHGYGKQAQLFSHTQSGSDIAKLAMDIFDKNYDMTIPFRRVGVSAFDLIREDEAQQFSFFETENNKKKNLDKQLDIIRARYGIDTIKRGIVKQHPDICTIFDDIDFKPFKK